jgi:hypothetical protein
VADELVELFRGAKQEILIVTAYLIPTNGLETAVAQAVSRGVNVRILTNSIGSNNHLTAHSAYRNHIGALLNSGADLYEVRTDAGDRDRYMLRPIDRKVLALHAKALVIDNDKVFIGSPNLDPHSLRINTEMGLLVVSESFNQTVRSAVEDDLSGANAWRLEFSRMEKCYGWRMVILSNRNRQLPSCRDWKIGFCLIYQSRVVFSGLPTVIGVKATRPISDNVVFFGHCVLKLSKSRVVLQADTAGGEFTMKTRIVIAAVASVFWTASALTDSTAARCDIYPAGSDHTDVMIPCTFAQRQGYIIISRSDGVTHELAPRGDTAGNFTDQDGRNVYRQSELGDQGLIFRFPNESVYVYWSTAALEPQHDNNPTAPFSTADYDATSLLRCKAAGDAEFDSCPAGISRMEDGQASIVVQNQLGDQFTINFMTDYVNATNREVEARLDGDTWHLEFENGEVWEVPLAAIEGG